MARAPAEWPPWSSDEFLGALQAWYFPDARIAIVECEGVRVRTLLRGSTRAVSSFWPFAFYLEPLAVDTVEAVSVPYLADVVLSTPSATERSAPRGTVLCPYVDWRTVTSFESYLESRQPLPGQDSPVSIARKARRLERELGPLAFRRGIDSATVFDQLLGWKAEQFRRTGGANRLESPHNIGFYHELRRRGFARASTLEAGGRVIAGKIGLFAGGRQLSRLTVYDHSLRKLSPGSVLELESLRASFDAGELEFDFLMGTQPYKFTWATHLRRLGELGAEPRLERLARNSRAQVGGFLRGKPGAVASRELARRLFAFRPGRGRRRL